MTQKIVMIKRHANSSSLNYMEEVFMRLSSGKLDEVTMVAETRRF